MTRMVLETLFYMPYNQMTRLLAPEYFIANFILFTPFTVYCSHRALYTVHTVHCMLFTPCTVYCSHRALYTVHTVHCRQSNYNIQPNKVHCIVSTYSVLQYHDIQYYMFRFLMGPLSGIRIKVPFHNICLFCFVKCYFYTNPR
jgi:hypothetical protein